MGRIKIRSQPVRRVFKTPFSTNSWVQWCMPPSQATQEDEIRRITIPGQPGEKVRP
jgi:hypothetical protein